MQHTGRVYLSKRPPQAGTASNGTFQLQLLVLDRISSRSTEPWRLLWAGDEAQAWWAAHGARLQPGNVLDVTCERARVHAIASRPLPITEIHAHIVRAELVTQAGNTQEQNPCDDDA